MICFADDFARLSRFIILDHASEAQLNPKARRLVINIPSAKSIGWNDAWITIDLTAICFPCTSVVTSLTAYLSAELPQLMSSLIFVAPGFCSRCKGASCGSNQPGAKKRFGCFVCVSQSSHGFKDVNDGGGCPLDSFKITALLVNPAIELRCGPQEVLVGFW